MRQIDARGRACPEPVIMTKQALEAHSPGSLRVLVDNEAACSNVSRFFTSMGYEASVKTADGGLEVTGTCTADKPVPEMKKDEETGAEKKIMVMVTADRMGSGDDTLGCRLMTNFVHTLNEMGPDLWRLVFVNSGVRLAVEGSRVLDAVRELEKNGTVVLVCGTCLDHYGLLKKKQAGQTTNMLDIVTSMQLADQVINI